MGSIQVRRFQLSRDSDDANCTRIPGKATDITVGADGSTYIVGVTDCDASGYQPGKLNGNVFTAFARRVSRVGAGPDGLAWLLNKNGGRYHHVHAESSTPVYDSATGVNISPDGMACLRRNHRAGGAARQHGTDCHRRRACNRTVQGLPAGVGFGVLIPPTVAITA